MPRYLVYPGIWILVWVGVGMVIELHSHFPEILLSPILGPPVPIFVLIGTIQIDSAGDVFLVGRLFVLGVLFWVVLIYLVVVGRRRRRAIETLRDRSGA